MLASYGGTRCLALGKTTRPCYYSDVSDIAAVRVIKHFSAAILWRTNMNYDLCLHIDSREPSMLKLVLKNAANYIKGLPGERFQLVVVANGPAVTQFSKSNEEFRALAAPLQDQGLRILLCANALADNSMTNEDIWPGCDVVPAGLVEIVRLQREGFAYIKP